MLAGAIPSCLPLKGEVVEDRRGSLTVAARTVKGPSRSAKSNKTKGDYMTFIVYSGMVKNDFTAYLRSTGAHLAQIPVDGCHARERACSGTCRG
jgi:hypothetical protein